MKIGDFTMDNGYTDFRNIILKLISIKENSQNTLRT